jgi:hypothetical protein
MLTEQMLDKKGTEYLKNQELKRRISLIEKELKAIKKLIKQPIPE